MKINPSLAQCRLLKALDFPQVNAGYYYVLSNDCDGYFYYSNVEMNNYLKSIGTDFDRYNDLIFAIPDDSVIELIKNWYNIIFNYQ